MIYHMLQIIYCKSHRDSRRVKCGLPHAQKYKETEHTHTHTHTQVDALALSGEKYKPYKGVRFVTKAGRFQVRS